MERARGCSAQLHEGKVEATSGIEPLNRGFADPPLNHLGTSPRTLPPLGRFRRLRKPASWWVRLAAPRGFEPRQTDSKSAVLPLDEGAETRSLAGRLPDRQHQGSGAEDGTRTRDPHLGKVMLYQLSHFRSINRASHLWCREPGSNWRHRDFQSRALPTELSRPELSTGCPSARRKVPRPTETLQDDPGPAWWLA